MKIHLALILPLALLAPLPAMAQAANDSGGAVRATVPPEAETFAQQAAIAGLFEIEAAKLALDRATDPDVRIFAERMIADHSAADEELRRTAGVTSLPSAVDAAHAEQLAALAASGSDFDRVYVEQQIDAHRQAVQLFTQFSTTGPNGVFRAFAAKKLPVLEDHQQMAGMLAEKLGI